MIEHLAAALRRLARLPLLRRLRRTRAANRLADAVYHGRLVEESWRFALRELVRPGVVGTYRPKGTGAIVVLRHGTSDRYILNELFRFRLYEPPAEAERELRALGRGPRVVDLGAHVGLFGVLVLERFAGAEVLAVEADPLNFALLERCIEDNAAGDRWLAVNAAASTAEGRTWFLAGRFAESQVAEQPTPGAVEVPARDVLPDLLDADVVKIDVEGSEWPILHDERFGKLGAILVFLEYHPEGCPEPDSRVAAIDRFRGLGYEVREIDVPHAPPGVGMLSAWKRREPT
jgi:FkbM family methyltransferase